MLPISEIYYAEKNICVNTYANLRVIVIIKYNLFSLTSAHEKITLWSEKLIFDIYN